MNKKEICELMAKIPTFEGSKPIYNPMETFVEYVSQKRDMPLINIGRSAKSIRTTWS